eukprot:scaffold65634_cov50-Cyclotella_meneghiniana.AAC.2
MKGYVPKLSEFQMIHSIHISPTLLHNIIQHMHDETFRMVHTVTDLRLFTAWGHTRQLFTLPELKNQPVETIAGKAFQSKLHNIIQYIHDETLGWSSSNGLDVMVQTVTDLALFTWGHKTAFYPPRAQNSAHGDHCWQSIPIQTA